MAEILQWILESIRAHGGWSVFVGVMIEQIIIPLPSPVIIMGAGAILIPAQEPWLAAFWDISLHIVLPGTLASTIGALLCYYLGRWGGKVFVDRFHNYLGFNWTDVLWMGQRISTSGAAATLFFMRAIPVVPLSLVSLVGGVLGLPLRTFLLWTFLGSIPRCYLLSFLGWQLGASAINWAAGVNKFESIVSVVLVGLVAGAVWYLRKRVRRQMGTQEPVPK